MWQTPLDHFAPIDFLKRCVSGRRHLDRGIRSRRRQNKTRKICIAIIIIKYSEWGECNILQLHKTSMGLLPLRMVVLFLWLHWTWEIIHQIATCSFLHHTLCILLGVLCTYGTSKCCRHRRQFFGLRHPKEKEIHPANLFAHCLDEKFISSHHYPGVLYISSSTQFPTHQGLLATDSGNVRSLDWLSGRQVVTAQVKLLEKDT